MNFFEGFPWSNKQSLNLDWLLTRMKNLEGRLQIFEAYNRITYGGIWNITSQYVAWAVVTNGDKSYLSLKPVPAGVSIDNGEYWLLIGDLDPRIGALSAEVEQLRGNVRYYVKDFGAKGDGVADDYQAIQACFDECMKNGGGEVVFDPGTYNISQGLIIRPHTAAVDDNSRRIHFLKMDLMRVVGRGDVEIKATAQMLYMLRTYDFSWPANVGSYSNFYTVVDNLRLNGNNMATTGLYIYNALHAQACNNRIFQVDIGIEVFGYGELWVFANIIEANKTCYLSQSGGDSLVIKNDLYINPNDGIGFDLTDYAGSSIYLKNTLVPQNIETTPTNTSVGFNIHNDNPETWTGPVFITATSFDEIHQCVQVSGRCRDIECWDNKIIQGYEKTKQVFFRGLNTALAFIHDNLCGCSNIGAYYQTAFVILENCTECRICDNETLNTIDSAVTLVDSTNNIIQGNHFRRFSIGSADGAAVLMTGNCYNNIIKNNTVTQNVDTNYWPNRSVVAFRENDSSGFNTYTGNDNVGDVQELYKIAASSKALRHIPGYNAPAAGVWRQGDIIWNSNPVPGGVLCWVCSTAGEPGTWTPINIPAAE